MYVLFPAFKICNAVLNVSLITTSLETVVCNCDYYFLCFPRKLSINGHVRSKTVLSQRVLFLSATILPSELRINKGLILERFYLTREIIAAQLHANEYQFHGFCLLVMAFFTYCYSKLCFTRLNKTTLLRKKFKEWFTCHKNNRKERRLKRRVLRARSLVVTVTKVKELPTSQRKKDQPT